MLTIRLTRKGKKNQPFFRVVVIDKRRSAKGGRPSEILGYIDPLTKRKSLKKERILYWISVGAQPSATVHNLLVSEKIIDAKKINKFKKSKKAVATVVAPASAEVSGEAKPASVTEAPAVATETPAPEAQKEGADASASA
ncbi:MAG: 30S ribosomal protein S16 [Candidatus Staskawiczbacteria bacterium]|nr:30S ribosomal protein S16 [Candidatus Staskawiczbacteria bacterium]